MMRLDVAARPPAALPLPRLAVLRSWRNDVLRHDFQNGRKHLGSYWPSTARHYVRVLLLCKLPLYSGVSPVIQRASGGHLERGLCINNWRYRMLRYKSVSFVAMLGNESRHQSTQTPHRKNYLIRPDAPLQSSHLSLGYVIHIVPCESYNTDLLSLSCEMPV